MARIVPALVVVVFLTSALAGCFGGGGDDDDDDATPSPTPTPTPTNNTTPPDPFEDALIPPVPAFAIEVTNGSAALEAPYFVAPGESLTVTLDGSGSSDEDGEIVVYSWIISGPAGFSEKGNGQTFNFTFNVTEFHFGVYPVRLRVLDDDNILNETRQNLIVNYDNTISEPLGMTGPGTFACQSYPADRPAGSPVAPSEVVPGTYSNRSFSVRSNATLIELELTYTSQSTATMGMYLFGPGQDIEACDTALANAPAAASPVTLSHEGNLTAGSHAARLELNGPSVSSYSLHVRVTYAAPGAASEDDDA